MADVSRPGVPTSTAVQAALHGLNQRQADFVLNYVVTKNGTKAARAAGYGGGDPALAAAASRLLKNVKVQQALDALNKPAVDKAMVTVQSVVDELANIGFADWREFVKIKKDNQGNEIGAVLLLKDKIAALKLCGDHVGAFKNAGDQDEKPSIHVHLSDKMTPDDARQFLNSVLKR